MFCSAIATSPKLDCSCCFQTIKSSTFRNKLIKPQLTIWLTVRGKCNRERKRNADNLSRRSKARTLCSIRSLRTLYSDLFSACSRSRRFDYSSGVSLEGSLNGNWREEASCPKREFLYNIIWVSSREYTTFRCMTVLAYARTWGPVSMRYID